MISDLAGQPNEFFISPIRLGNRCNIRGIVMKTLLTYLELDGYIASTSPRYDSYRFIPSIPGQELINKFQGERKEFVRALIKCSKMKKTWFHIDLVEATQKLQCERMRIVKALNYFSEKGWLELKATGLVHGYRKLKPFGSIEELASHYFKKVADREENEVERTRRFFDFVKAQQCQAAYLSEHFGQPLSEPCGHCSFCIGQGNLTVPEPSQAKLTRETIAMVKGLVEAHSGALGDSRSIARFLCGITSPSLTRAKLTKHASFGSCESVSFDVIMKQTEAEVQFSEEPPF